MQLSNTATMARVIFPHTYNIYDTIIIIKNKFIIIDKASLGYKQGYYKNKDDFMMIMIYDIQS